MTAHIVESWLNQNTPYTFTDVYQDDKENTWLPNLGIDRWYARVHGQDLKSFQQNTRQVFDIDGYGFVICFHTEGWVSISLPHKPSDNIFK